MVKKNKLLNSWTGESQRALFKTDKPNIEASVRKKLLKSYYNNH